MTPAQIFISGARYSSSALHGDNHWRRLPFLASQRPGTYTANVDGREGRITIDASGWWFDPAGVAPVASQQPIEAGEGPNAY